MQTQEYDAIVVGSGISGGGPATALSPCSLISIESLSEDKPATIRLEGKTGCVTMNPVAGS